MCCACNSVDALSIGPGHSKQRSLSWCHGDPSDRIGFYSWAADIGLLGAESLCPGFAASIDELCSEHVVVEGVRQLPIGDVDNAVVELVRFVESLPAAKSSGTSWRHSVTVGPRARRENFLCFVARQWWDSRGPEGWSERRAAEQAAGVSHLASITALRVPAQLIPLAGLAHRRPDPRLGRVNLDALAATRSVVVNIDYPLGKAAYNILREIAFDSGAGLRGVYVLGKAATLNADMGDVMISRSSVVHNEHSNSTYWGVATSGRVW
jgi:hypothetical protein